MNSSRATFPYRVARFSRGFTLMEVLVALAVLAIGILALIGGAANFARNGADLKQRAVAQWVAENRLTELSLQNSWPATGKRDGSVEMAGVEWEWETQVEKTPNKYIRRAVVVVRRGSGGVSVRLEGFLPSPALRGRT